jgi:hypothetical protein
MYPIHIHVMHQQTKIAVNCDNIRMLHLQHHWVAKHHVRLLIIINLVVNDYLSVLDSWKPRVPMLSHFVWLICLPILLLCHVLTHLLGFLLLTAKSILDDKRITLADSIRRVADRCLFTLRMEVHCRFFYYLKDMQSVTIIIVVII